MTEPVTPSGSEPPSRAWHVVALLIVGPILVLGYKVGSRISAERDAEKIVRPLGSYGPDGRPDARSLARVQRGSGALVETLEGMIREGPFEHRAPIARALGYSRRLECLRNLVLVLRDGCVDPEQVALPRDWPCACYPPDELALEAGEKGRAAMTALEKDEDPFVRGFAHEHLVATGERSIDLDLVRLAGEDGMLGERAGALLAAPLEAKDAPRVSLDGATGLLALAGPTPRGRVAAALLERSGAKVPDARVAELTALVRALSPADVKLVRDPRAVARAERSLARGDAKAVALLAELAAVDPRAREVLVAAVSSATDPAVREAASRALEGR